MRGLAIEHSNLDARQERSVAREWSDVAATYVQRRMKELGIPDDKIGADDPRAGKVLERARITLWDPGARLAWASSLDDVDC